MRIKNLINLMKIFTLMMIFLIMKIKIFNQIYFYKLKIKYMMIKN